MNTASHLQWEKLQAVFFDIDGTLSDTDDLMVAKLSDMLQPLSLLLPKMKIQRIARWLVMACESPGNFLYNLADRFDVDSLVIRVLNERTRKRKRPKKQFWLIEGVERMLPSLAERFALGIISARDEESSLAFLRQFNLGKYFSIVVTSQTCARTKPFPDPLLYAAKQLGVDACYCLMVGDTTVDMRAARLAGMQALGVLCGFGTRRELQRAGADLILNSPAELLDWIKS